MDAAREKRRDVAISIPTFGVVVSQYSTFELMAKRSSESGSEESALIHGTEISIKSSKVDKRIILPKFCEYLYVLK